jgi:hypothetical protein
VSASPLITSLPVRFFARDEVARLVAQIERLLPFEDVPEALARLRARYRIAVPSNGDPDMLERGSIDHFRATADACPQVYQRAGCLSLPVRRATRRPCLGSSPKPPRPTTSPSP